MGRISLWDMRIEPDCQELAIIVQYTVEEGNNPVRGKDGTAQGIANAAVAKHREKKKIKLRKSLSTASDVGKVAMEIMKKCPYIHDSKFNSLKQAIQKLQHQLIREELRTTAQDLRETVEENRGDEKCLEMEGASIEKLRDYIELLYEGVNQGDMRHKIIGSAKILSLCSDVPNLTSLIQDQTLMGALTRVFRDEYKKSMDLNYNIMRCFLAFSNFSDMHPTLIQYKVIELEVRRSEHREDKWFHQLKDYNRDSPHISRQQGSANTAEGQLQDISRRQFEREIASDTILEKRQDNLLYVCISILMNLAEDVSIEKKMIKKRLIPLLLAQLTRMRVNLLYLSISFLHKISSTYENLAACRDMGIVNEVEKIVPSSPECLTEMTMRLLYNLSFHPENRKQIVGCGLVPRLVELLKKPSYRAKGLGILYHLSIEKEGREMLACKETTSITKQLIIKFPRPILAKELVALAINMSLNERCAAMFTEQRGLRHLMDRAIDTKDPSLLKIIRNISIWTHGEFEKTVDPGNEYSPKGLWRPVVEQLIQLSLKNTTNHDLLVEVLGTLGNMTPFDLPTGMMWSHILGKHNLLGLVAHLLVPDMSQNDIVLEVIILVAVLAQNDEASSLLVQAGIIQSLTALWSERRDDVEIQLQLLYAYWHLLLASPAREELMYKTEAVADMMEALDSRNNIVKDMASYCLDLVLELDRLEDGSLGAIGEQVKRRRFWIYNREWLEVFVEDFDLHDTTEGLYTFERLRIN